MTKYAAVPGNLTFASYQQRSGEGLVKYQNQALYEANKKTSTAHPEGRDEVLLMFNPADLFNRDLINKGVVPGVITPPDGPATNPDGSFIGVFPPVGEFVGQYWATRAVLGSAPAIAKEPTLKQWDGTAWVEPRFELMAQAVDHFLQDDDGTGKWQPLGCYLRGDSTYKDAVPYDSNVDQYPKGAIVTTGTGNAKKWWRAKVALTDIAPTNNNATLVANNWEWGLSEAEMCAKFSESAASILAAVAKFVGKETGLNITDADITSAVKALIESYKAAQAEVIAGTEGNKWVSPATLQGKAATAAEAVEGTVTNKWMSPFTSLAAMANFVNKGVGTWEPEADHTNGHGMVIGSDGKYYMANAAGKPGSNDPVLAASRPAHWFGPFDSVGDVLTRLMGAGTPAATIIGSNFAGGEIIISDVAGNRYNLLDVMRKAICDADPFPMGATVLYNDVASGKLHVPYVTGDGIMEVVATWQYQGTPVTMYYPIVNGFPTERTMTDGAEPFGPTLIVENYNETHYDLIPKEYYPANLAAGSQGENGAITKLTYYRMRPNPMCVALSPKPAISTFMATSLAAPGPVGTPPAPPPAPTPTPTPTPAPTDVPAIGEVVYLLEATTCEEANIAIRDAAIARITNAKIGTYLWSFSASGLGGAGTSKTVESTASGLVVTSPATFFQKTGGTITPNSDNPGDGSTCINPVQSDDIDYSLGATRAIGTGCGNGYLSCAYKITRTA